MAAPALPSTARLTPKIVWGTGTGIDTSSYDDVSRWYLNNPGLVVNGIGRDQNRSYSPPKSPSFDLTLTNHDGRFSSGGPLGLFLGRGPDVTLDATWGVEYGLNTDEIGLNSDAYLLNGTAATRLFDGIADDMPRAIGRDQRRVQVRALSQLAILGDQQPSSALYQSVRTDEAVAILLDAIGWRTDRRVLGRGTTVLLQFCLDGRTSATAVLDAIIKAEGAGACAYEQGGWFHFEGTAFRSENPRSAEVTAVFLDGPRRRWDDLNTDLILLNDPNVSLNGDTGADLMYLREGLEFRSNPDEVVRTVTVNVNVRTPTAVQKIWEFGGPLVLGPGETRDVPIDPGTLFRAAVAPEPGTDYLVSAGALVGVSLTRTSGTRTVLRFVADVVGATVLGVTSAGPQLRAVSLPVTSTLPITSDANTALAAARTRPKDTTIAAWADIEPARALDLANRMALRYSRERPQVSFRLRNADAAHMRAMLAARISDRILFVHGHEQISDPYWIEMLDVTVAPGGGQMTMTFGCEQVYEPNAAVYGTARYGFDQYGEVAR